LVLQWLMVLGVGSMLIGMQFWYKTDELKAVIRHRRNTETQRTSMSSSSIHYLHQPQLHNFISMAQSIVEH